MKNPLLFFVFCSSICCAQITIDKAREISFTKYKVGSYSYSEEFLGHQGYGAPAVTTADGGAAFFGGTADEKGTCGLVVKIDKEGNEQWKQCIRPQFDEMETQSVVQDNAGNFYVFMLSYDSKRYRGGTERIVHINKAGKIVWDKTIGTYQLMNSPTVSYIRALKDGRIYMRGHVVTDKPEKDMDPKYRFWEGWINSQGKLTQKSAEVIDWSNQEWQKKFRPEKSEEK